VGIQQLMETSALDLRPTLDKKTAYVLADAWNYGQILSARCARTPDLWRLLLGVASFPVVLLELELATIRPEPRPTG
jgi:hypothetical protein